MNHTKGHRADEVLADLRAGARQVPPREIRRHPLIVPEDGRARDISWPHRMFERGARGADGKRIRLPYAIGPSGKFTTAPAILRWLSELSAVTIQVPDQFTDANAAADARLAAQGL